MINHIDKRAYEDPIAANAHNTTTLWTLLQRDLGSIVAPKEKKTVMRIASRIVARRTDTTRVEFMDDFVTTLGRRIYLPFVIGTEEEGWSFRAQMLLAVHEHQHVAQWRKQPVRFLAQYARSTRKRALFEAEAFLAEFEACAMFDWNPPSLEQRLGTLNGYGVTAADIQAARDWITPRLVETELWPTTRAGKVAQRWAALVRHP